MSQQILLTVPDHVYRQAEALARRRAQAVETVLVETLSGAFPKWPVDPRREQMRREEAAFEAMREALLPTHRGLFVAIREGQVVDHDAQELALMDRVRARFPDELVLIREVTAEPPAPLHFRSPRFVRER